MAETTNKRETIKQILMDRDDMSSEDANSLIQQAKDAFNEYITNGEMDYAQDICSEYFGLEPDYLDEFIF